MNFHDQTSQSASHTQQAVRSATNSSLSISQETGKKPETGFPSYDKNIKQGKNRICHGTNEVKITDESHYQRLLGYFTRYTSSNVTQVANLILSVVLQAIVPSLRKKC